MNERMKYGRLAVLKQHADECHVNKYKGWMRELVQAVEVERELVEQQQATIERVEKEIEQLESVIQANCSDYDQVKKVLKAERKRIAELEAKLVELERELSLTEQPY